MARYGLVLGFEPFAGLPTNPASTVLPLLDGRRIGGVTLKARPIPVSLGRIGPALDALLDGNEPALVLALGLAAGAPILRVEMLAVNAAHLGVADNDGERPAGGVRLTEEGPEARRATWDGAAVAAAIEAAGLPARLSFHAGTHLCNATLYALLGRLERYRPPPPCGFLHLPHTPEEVVALRRRAAAAGAGEPEPASMALSDQLRAIEAALAVMVAAVA
jgi:pyroglutamyl-peptidase